MWLFKTDWRTTNFEWPIMAAIVAVPSLILVRILGALGDKLGEWESGLEARIKTKKELAASRRSKSKPA